MVGELRLYTSASAAPPLSSLHATPPAQELGRQLQHWEWRRFHFKQMKQLCSSAGEEDCTHRLADTWLTLGWHTCVYVYVLTCVSQCTTIDNRQTNPTPPAPPGLPKDVRLTVTSSHKLTVTFAEAEGDRRSGNIITRYRGEGGSWQARLLSLVHYRPCGTMLRLAG